MCNGSLAPVPKSDVAAELPPGTRRTYHEFSRCESCGRVYWRGAHGNRITTVVGSAKSIVDKRRHRSTVPGSVVLDEGGQSVEDSW